MFNFNPGQPFAPPYGQPMQPQYMQPMQQVQPQPQAQPVSGLNRVTGPDGARAFTMPPNAVSALFDDTRDVFYIKTTDSGGFPTVKAYRFTPLEEEPRTPFEQTMTRADIEKIVREEVNKYAKQFIPTGTASPSTAAEYVAAAEPVYASDAG